MVDIWVSNESDVSNAHESGSDDCWLVRSGDYNLEWFQFSWHKVGWLVSGLCALVATIISVYLMAQHLRNYRVPNEQRYIIRIILLIPIYGIVSWLGYRFYRESPYIEAVRDLYEAFVISFFMLLLLHYIGSEHDERIEALRTGGSGNNPAVLADASAEDTEDQMFDKNEKADVPDEKPMKWPFPFNCFVIRPTSANTLHFISFGVLQYCVIKPILTVVIIVTHAEGIYCPQSMSPKYASVWVTVVNFISVSIAMYFLIALYMVLKPLIADKKPLWKFLGIKLVIFFSFWQELVLKFLGSNNFHIIHETKMWTKDNIIEGLNSILICAEMVIFAVLYLYAFKWQPYQFVEDKGAGLRGWRLLYDAFNIFDVFKLTKFYSRWFWEIVRRGRNPVEKDRAYNDVNILARYRAGTLRRRSRNFQRLDSRNLA
ncbi:hypothetical protein H4219_001514 [Mycoemilia scoparia]|uniref:DUF300-domain-containing protein n=1 Tax=Mycoemilia scoparia TaxID=417184 RepID=A0A9W8A0S7_9FUNG|nr:hypothetical protein H4219_001514 [Mycoemilia scoparia]